MATNASDFLHLSQRTQTIQTIPTATALTYHTSTGTSSWDLNRVEKLQGKTGHTIDMGLGLQTSDNVRLSEYIPSGTYNQSGMNENTDDNRDNINRGDNRDDNNYDEIDLDPSSRVPSKQQRFSQRLTGGISLVKNEITGKRTLTKTFESQLEKNPIYIFKEYTAWLLILYKIFRINPLKALYFNRLIISNKKCSKIVLSLCLAVIFSNLIEFILQSEFHQGQNATFEPFGCAWAVLTLICIFILFFMINVDMFRHIYANEFSVYWRVYDASIELLLNFAIMQTNDIGLFNGNYTQWEIVLTIIFQILFVCVFGTLFVAMIEAYLGINRYFRMFMVLMGICFYFREVFYHLLRTDLMATWNWRICVLKHKFTLTFQLNDILILKSVDAIIWLVYQLWTMCRHPNMVTINNVNREWKVVKSRS